MNPYYELLKIQANTISMKEIFDHFNLDTNSNFSSHVSCPFPTHIHNSGTPSMKVYPETKSFYCFGCHKGGTALNFTKYYKLFNTYEETLDYLKKHFNLSARSLTSTFNKIRKNIQSQTTEVDKSVFIRKYSDPIDKIGCFTLSITDNENAHLQIFYYYECYDDLVSLFLNNNIDRDTFEREAKSIQNNIIGVFKKCLEEENKLDKSVIDAANIWI